MDVLGGSEPEPQSLNRYTYVGNSPILYIDPDGMRFVGAFSLGRVAALTGCLPGTDCISVVAPAPKMASNVLVSLGSRLLLGALNSAFELRTGDDLDERGANFVLGLVGTPGSGVAGPGFRSGGQVHHAISRVIHRALQRVPALAGKYSARDPRWVATAVDHASHRGYQRWHRELDRETVEWLRSNPGATVETLEAFLRQRYQRPDLMTRFPEGLP